MESDTEPKESVWQKTPYANLVRFVPSKTYFARIRISGKLIRKSLKTNVLSTAKLRLADLEKEERKKAASGKLESKADVLFKDAVEAYRQNGFRPAEPKNKKDTRQLKPASISYYEERIAALLKSWPSLENTEVRKITETDCKKWADKARKEVGATVFNHTLGIVRNAIDFGIKAGVRYDNPARAIIRESESPKALELPTREKFNEFVNEIENGGGGFSKACANLVRFLAYGGFRKSEAANVTWADCDFQRNLIIVRGHPETGLKNRKPGEIRIVQMNPTLRTFLECLKSERPECSPADRVMTVRECQKAMDRAAKKIGMPRITHHDLRHYHATVCIEAGVDVPTVSLWLGHKDGGALAMKVYGHVRDQHSRTMAEKVDFGVDSQSTKKTSPNFPTPEINCEVTSGP